MKGKYLCEVGYACGEKSGSWTSIAVHVFIDEHTASGLRDLELESHLLRKAREAADEMVDERQFEWIAHVWLLTYEWLDSVEEGESDVVSP